MKHWIKAMAVSALLTGASDAIACRVHNHNPDEAQLAKLPADHVGIVGKVVRSYVSDETKANGEAVVLVEVQKSFGKDAPAVGEHIFIFNPGCCVCIGIPTESGQVVYAGLVGLRGQPFSLSWPRK